MGRMIHCSSVASIGGLSGLAQGLDGGGGRSRGREAPSSGLASFDRGLYALAQLAMPPLRQAWYPVSTWLPLPYSFHGPLLTLLCTPQVLSIGLC